jgi:hypothetical protein
MLAMWSLVAKNKLIGVCEIMMSKTWSLLTVFTVVSTSLKRLTSEGNDGGMSKGR